MKLIILTIIEIAIGLGIGKALSNWTPWNQEEIFIDEKE